MTEGNFIKVAVVVAGAGNLLDEGVAGLVVGDTNVGDESEEAIKASAPSLLKDIGWWVVGDNASIEVEDNEVSRRRPGVVLWAWSFEEVVVVVLFDNRGEGEVLSPNIRRTVAASVLLPRLLDPGPISNWSTGEGVV